MLVYLDICVLVLLWSSSDPLTPTTRLALHSEERHVGVHTYSPFMSSVIMLQRQPISTNQSQQAGSIPAVFRNPPLPREEERTVQDDAEGTFLLLNIQKCESSEATQTKIRPMTDVASQGQEESGYREVKGEAAGTEGSARVKLIQCKMNRIKESTLKKPTDPPQSNRLHKTQ